MLTHCRYDGNCRPEACPNAVLPQMSLEDKPRTGKLLRSFSNSFKKGTASLKRGLTPRSRTSSQTQELEAALPPPALEAPREAREAREAQEPPAPAPAPSTQQPAVLENHVHVKIAEVSWRLSALPSLLLVFALSSNRAV